MNVVIFGATGATGRCLVEQALSQGYTVRPSRATRWPCPSGMHTSPLSPGTCSSKRASRKRLQTRMRSSARSAGMIDSEWRGLGILAKRDSVALAPGISLMR